MESIKKNCNEEKLNIRYYNDQCSIGISMDETTNSEDIAKLLKVFGVEPKSQVRYI